MVSPHPIDVRSISVAVGTFSGFGVVALLQQLMSKEAMHSIGWRICFWLGLLVGLVGLFLRSKAWVYCEKTWGSEWMGHFPNSCGWRIAYSGQELGSGA